jgi:hypothetical protein
MKKVIIMLSVAIVSITTNYAQNDCSNLLQFKKGFKSQMTNYDKKDQVQSVVNSEIVEVRNTATEAIAVCAIKMENAKGKKEMESMKTEFRCSNGVFYMNFKDLMSENQALRQMEGAEMKIEGGEMGFPSNLSVGQTLDDTNMSMQMIMNGTPLMKMTFNMKERKVEAKETVTTPAGTFDCFKVTYSVSLSSGFGGTSKGAMWISKGLTIKSETYDKKGNKQGYSLLTMLEK